MLATQETRSMIQQGRAACLFPPVLERHVARWSMRYEPWQSPDLSGYSSWTIDIENPVPNCSSHRCTSVCRLLGMYLPQVSTASDHAEQQFQINGRFELAGARSARTWVFENPIIYGKGIGQYMSANSYTVGRLSNEASGACVAGMQLGKV